MRDGPAVNCHFPFRLSQHLANVNIDRRETREIFQQLECFVITRQRQGSVFT